MEAFFSFLNRAGEVLAAWAGPMLLQSCLLFILLLLLDSLLRKRIPAGARYTLWLLFLVKLLLPPTLALPTGVGTLLPDRQETAFLRPPPIPVEDPNPARLSLEPLLAVRLPQGSPPPSTHQSPRPRNVSPAPPRREGSSLAWTGILFLGWAGGVLFLGLFLLSNLRRASRLLRGARPAPPALQKLARACASQVGLRRPFPLLLSGKAPSPFALGLFRPKVILPLKPALEIPSHRLRTVLLHEAIHIKRWDLPVNLLQGVIQVLYFFHPLLWFANGTLRRTREEAVDETVLYFAEKEKEMYLQSLLALARKGGRRLLPSQALLGILERESHLASRVRRILEITAPTRPGGGPRTWVLFAALGAFLLPMARPQPPVRVPPQVKRPAKPRKPAPAKPVPPKPTPPAKKDIQPLLSRARPAVDLALNWLARHQDEDGKWSAARFDAHCKGRPCTGKGAPIHDVGITGLALTAFLSAKNTPWKGPYQATVKKGVRWLRLHQRKDGLFGEKAGQSFFYGHLAATIAMVRAFGQSRAEGLRLSAQKALSYISQARNPYKAWRYFPRDGDNDSSITGWAVTALAWGKTYENMGLKISIADFKGAAAWFDEKTDPETGRVGYITRGSPPARPQSLMDGFPASKSESITAEALHARLVMGLDPNQVPFLRKAVKLLKAKPPLWSEEDGTIDMYYWYFGTLAAREAGGEFWKFWRKKILQALLPHQRKAGCARGSWDPAGVWGKEAGRIYATALMVQALEACIYEKKNPVGPAKLEKGIIRPPAILATRIKAPRKQPRAAVPARPARRNLLPILVQLQARKGEGGGPSGLSIVLMDPNVPPGAKPITKKALSLPTILPALKEAGKKGVPTVILRVSSDVPSNLLGKTVEALRGAGFPRVQILFK